MPARKSKPVDVAAVRELELYADNDRELYQLKINTYWRNAFQKVKAGKFDPNKAVTLFEYFTKRASDKYKREFGYGFDAATRKHAAREYVQEFVEAVRNGEIG